MERTSNSIILKNILNEESCELKQMIDDFMCEKLAEFQEKITERCNTTYNKSEEGLDEVVFDDLPEGITGIIDACAEQSLQEVERAEILKLKGKKYFIIGHPYYILSGLPNISYHHMYYIFKDSYIIFKSPSTRTKLGKTAPNIYEFHRHQLPTQLLHIIKMKSYRFEDIVFYIERHPQYFQPNLYAENKKQEEVESHLEQIAKDEEQIKEEKQKLFIVKERLLEMKTTLERERKEFEEEKRKYLSQKKSIDIDKCFEELL
jgi:hypothetical protein